MTDLKSRLEAGAAALFAADVRRKQTQDPNLGYAIERYIVDRELRELEREAAENPVPGVPVAVPASKNGSAS